jgi:hypothetical protein
MLRTSATTGRSAAYIAANAASAMAAAMIFRADRFKDATITRTTTSHLRLRAGNFGDAA